MWGFTVHQLHMNISHIINIARLILQHTLKKLKPRVLTLIVMETNGLHIFYFLWTKSENYACVITVEWTNLGIESNQINLTMNNADSLFNFFQHLDMFFLFWIYFNKNILIISLICNVIFFTFHEIEIKLTWDFSISYLYFSSFSNG